MNTAMISSVIFISQIEVAVMSSPGEFHLDTQSTDTLSAEANRLQEASQN